MPASLMLALYEALHYDSLEDAEVMEGARKALLHLTSSHELRLADTGPPPGLYRLLAHHDTNLRSMVCTPQPFQLDLLVSTPLVLRMICNDATINTRVMGIT